MHVVRGNASAWVSSNERCPDFTEVIYMIAGEVIALTQLIKKLHVSDTSEMWLVKDTRVAGLQVVTREVFERKWRYVKC